MEPIIWEERLNIRVQNIDEQKQKIVEHINKIYVRFHEKADARTLFDLLNELGEGLRMHFALEEKIMQQLSYPEIQDHKKLHKLYIRKTLNLRRLVSDTPENLTEENLRTLGNWLMDHICTEDQRFAPFARIRMLVDGHKRTRRLR
ncbi:bacteriohemerythrin [Desulfococcaceae bacterium OttesenSCG-928-F15]|nr:bacteriohemerythrin [Desulfococcaceae bacterium OttesenSCG-928-F15]